MRNDIRPGPLCSSGCGSSTVDILLGFARDERRQDCFLRVQAIFGLLENCRCVRLERFVGDFFSAISRQAMHHQSIGAKVGDLAIDLISLELGNSEG